MSRVLIECFKDDIGTDNEHLLHEDKYISKTMKKKKGKKQFDEFDKYGEEVWSNAWNEFSRVVFHTRVSE
ncbi:hypothetical protein ACFVQB_14090 [Paenibacillus sp. NPDC057886]|uniref:hypothetical protein n=1 Tax=Paenibacillus sp. NPDC057886 TaxID=3346270 RepID=UPI003683817D